MADFIPRKDVDFNQWVGTFMTTIQQLASSLSIPQTAVDELVVLQTAWNTKYSLAETPATRTSATVVEKDEARAALEPKLRTFVSEYVRHNHLVTDADRVNLGLPIPKTTRTPAPIPTTYPEFSIDSSVIRRLTIHFRDQGDDSGAKPYGVHGAEIKWGYSSEETPSPATLLYSVFDTRSPYTLEFEEANRGRTVYFCLRWENTRGDKGPWSEIVSAIVP
jgi:hypothetical protein